MKSSWAQMSLTIVPGLMTPGQRISARHAERAFPVGRLLALERRRAAVGPGHDLGAVVGRVDDDGVVGDAEVVELLQQLADLAVVSRPCRRDRGRVRSCPAISFLRCVKTCMRVVLK